MERKVLEKAKALSFEIDRLDMLIEFVNDSKLDYSNTSDFQFLVSLIGKDNVLAYMRVRKRMLEKELDEL